MVNRLSRVYSSLDGERKTRCIIKSIIAAKQQSLAVQSINKMKEEKKKAVGRETGKKRRRQGVRGNASKKKHHSKDHVSSQFPEATQLLRDWDWDAEDDPSANLKFRP